MSKDSLQGVFEEVNVSGVLRYFPRRRVNEGPSISLSEQPEKIENRNKDKKSIKQPKSTGAKLVALFSSIFKQSILKKKSKSTTVTKEDACLSRSSISFPHVIKNTWKDKCVALDSERDQDCHEAKLRVKNERSKSVDGNSTNKWLLDVDAKLWSEELFRKEETWRWRKSEEEDEGSESSSDLFELQNYDSIDGVSTNP